MGRSSAEERELQDYSQAGRNPSCVGIALYCKQHLPLRSVQIHRLRAGNYTSIPLSGNGSNHHGLPEGRSFMAGMAVDWSYIRRSDDNDRRHRFGCDRSDWHMVLDSICLCLCPLYCHYQQKQGHILDLEFSADILCTAGRNYRLLY